MIVLFSIPRIPFFSQVPIEDLSAEGVIIVGIVTLLILCPCLWFIKYLKDDALAKKTQDSLTIIHIAATIVSTVGMGAFLRSFELVNQWIEQQPLILLVYIALALSIFGVGIGKLIDYRVYPRKKRNVS